MAKKINFFFKMGKIHFSLFAKGARSTKVISGEKKIFKRYEDGQDFFYTQLYVHMVG